MGFFLGKAKQQGYPGIISTDPFHPGLFVNIRQKAAGPITDYERTENFQTGEVVIRWRDPRGQFQRRLVRLAHRQPHCRRADRARARASCSSRPSARCSSNPQQEYLGPSG